MAVALFDSLWRLCTVHIKLMQPSPTTSDKIPAQVLWLLGVALLRGHARACRVLLRPPVVVSPPPPSACAACMPLSSAINNGPGRLLAALLRWWANQAVLLVKAQVGVRHLCQIRHFQLSFFIPQHRPGGLFSALTHTLRIAKNGHTQGRQACASVRRDLTRVLCLGARGASSPGTA